jgi:hypothetical protein
MKWRRGEKREHITKIAVASIKKKIGRKKTQTLTWILYPQISGISHGDADLSNQ